MLELQARSKTMDKGAVKFAVYISVFALAFIMVGHVFPGQIQAVLKRPLFNLPPTTIDWWSVTHFGFFGILGYTFPDYLFELMILGILWEVVEDGLAPHDAKNLVDCEADYTDDMMRENFQTLWCDTLSRKKDYWYGKWDDIFANVLGLLLGHYLRMSNTFGHL